MVPIIAYLAGLGMFFLWAVAVGRSAPPEAYAHAQRSPIDVPPQSGSPLQAAREATPLEHPAHEPSFAHLINA